MQIIPAVDVRGGRCVRLYQGDYGRETVYGDDPAEMALHWQKLGAERLHVVDLDAARTADQVNATAVRSIVEAVTIPVELGGGIRALSDIEAWLAAGVDRVFLGTTAVENPEIVREGCLLYPGRVGVSADSRSGRVAMRGWQEGSGILTRHFVTQMVELGATFVAYTDIDRDGTLQGPDLDGVRELAELVPPGVELLVAGGIGVLEHVRAAAALSRLDGIIIGRALYDGSLRLEDAIAALSRS